MTHETVEPTHEILLRILSDMDAEAMPNERRALIISMMTTRLTDEDRAWAASVARGLPQSVSKADELNRTAP